MKVQCEVSLGELVDKITILKLKMKNISDENKVRLATHEHDILVDQLNELKLEGIDAHIERLLQVNGELWVIEDDIRECESRQDFGQAFIDLARSVYMTNDRRFELKNTINLQYNSGIKEVKSYEDYKGKYNGN